MIKNSTQRSKYIVLAISFFACFFSLHAQTPNLKFIHPVLFSGKAGEKKAVYKFADVIPGVDAMVKIEKISGGAYLVNIDDSTMGYYNAWQPIVGGPGTVGQSYIRWSISFQTTSGNAYTFPLFDLSAIDIDGDNGKIREFIDVNGQSSYDMPPVPTLLGLSSMADTDDNEDDNSNGDNANLHQALGPIVNRTDIDTVSLNVRINYHFINKSSIKVVTGSQVDDNGYTGGDAPERYSSLYFKPISNTIFTVLGVTYKSFDAFGNNSKVNLIWQTTEEINNDHYEVERSFDQNNFSNIGLVLGPQSSNAMNMQYSFKDENADLKNNKVAYYRLKQIDKDGKFTYSSVKMVRLQDEVKAYVQVSPNPFVESINVKFESSEEGKGDLRILSASGETSIIKHASIIKGFNSIPVTDLSRLPKGLYFVDIVVNGQIRDREKLIKY